MNQIPLRLWMRGFVRQGTERSPYYHMTWTYRWPITRRGGYPAGGLAEGPARRVAEAARAPRSTPGYGRGADHPGVPELRPERHDK